MPKVSVVIPVYNVRRYLKECLDSVLNQTLRDIEIICVDDGSTDGSEKILDEYAAKDSKIKVIHKENTGYGNSMNVGFNAASGDYIGIVESDDIADSKMFETLYNVAVSNDLDVVKSGYYFYFSKDNKNEKIEIVSKALNGKTICPATDFKSKLEMADFYNIKSTIWSAIYRRSFLKENKIDFLETPGASYQDSGFNFKVMATAKRLQLIRGAFLHYRQDNESSSVNSKGKVFCICDEYAEMHRYLEERPLLKGKLIGVLWRIKFDAYMWNLNRVGQKYKYLFMERFSEEFKQGLDSGEVDKSYFDDGRWKLLSTIAKDSVDAYNQYRLGESYNKEALVWRKKYEQINSSLSYRLGKILTFIPRTLYKFIVCIKKHGLVYTFTTSFGEFFGKKSK